MRAYISLPITGYDEKERRALAEKARAWVKKEFGAESVTTPFDLADELRTEIDEPSYSDYLMRDLAHIIDNVDTLFCLVNPHKTQSKGVRLEYQTAKIFGKKIYFEKDKI